MFAMNSVIFRELPFDINMNTQHTQLLYNTQTSSFFYALATYLLKQFYWKVMTRLHFSKHRSIVRPVNGKIWMVQFDLDILTVSKTTVSESVSNKKIVYSGYVIKGTLSKPSVCNISAIDTGGQERDSLCGLNTATCVKFLCRKMNICLIRNKKG